MPRILIAAPHRSSGKSTVATGLCCALREGGLRVQPFKKGPDFIDPMWLSAASGNDCRNLDFFMMGPRRISDVFARYAQGADLSVVECNHGLHDGLDQEGSDSSASLAKLLRSPLLLVVGTTGMARGIAALVKGMLEFEPGLPPAAVVLNRIGGARHESKIRAALERYCPVPVVGALPDLPDLRIPERHLGLTPLREDPGLEDRVRALGAAVREHLDLDRIIALARSASPVPLPEPGPDGIPEADVRIGVARDRAFTFYYLENLESLARAGAELVPFSPLDDPEPPDVDALYIGGGFPEFFMEPLEKNTSMRRSIRLAVERGLPVWAECGGLMYLSASLQWEGTMAKMAEALPCRIRMSRRPAGHGYVVLRGTDAFPWLQKMGELRGHEFHHSRVVEFDREAPFAFETVRGNGVRPGFDGVVHRNCVATYTHLHADGAPDWASGWVGFIRACSGRG